jgi:hypothetical protein
MTELCMLTNFDQTIIVQQLETCRSNTGVLGVIATNRLPPVE